MDLLSMTTTSATGKDWSNLTLSPAFELHNVLQNLSVTEEDLPNSPQMGKEKDQFFAVFLKHLDNYVLPVIILLGIVGNIISFTGKCLHLLHQYDKNMNDWFKSKMIPFVR